MTGGKRRTTIRLVSAQEIAPNDEDPTPDDAMNALLQAQQGFQAAVDAADGVSLPSLTDFVD